MRERRILDKEKFKQKHFSLKNLTRLSIFPFSGHMWNWKIELSKLHVLIATFEIFGIFGIIAVPFSEVK